MEKLLKNKYSLIATIILIIVVAVVLWIVIRKIKNKFQDQSKDLLKKAGDTIKQANLTFKPYEYEQMADSLYRAMKGPGTTIVSIGKVISSLKNEDDWKMLIKAFGIRESSNLVYTFRGNLAEWLEDELDEQQRMDLSKGLKTIGVNF